MKTIVGAIINKVTISIVVIITFSIWPSHGEAMQASNDGEVSNTRLNIQSAFFYLDEGDRYVSLAVTRDEIANTTSLNFGYRYPDPTDSNLIIFISGNEGEIPNSAFFINSTSARLTVTTPDTYTVTRCVVNAETGDFTCEPTSASTFDVTWVADDAWTFMGTGARVATSGSVTVRTRSRVDRVSALASGTWDGFSGTNMTGELSDGEGGTLIREKMIEANPLFFNPLALQDQMETTWTLTDKINIRQASGFLYNDQGLNGGITVWHDLITKTTFLRFGYAFPDPNDPSRILFYQGGGEIPKSAFTITSTSARLIVTTPDSFPMVYCIITDIIGNPGAFICYPSPSPVTLDLVWIKDGYGSEHETFMNVLTEGSFTTRYHLEFNRLTAPISGTWSEVNEHAGTNMTGSLSNAQNVIISQESP